MVFLPDKPIEALTEDELRLLAARLKAAGQGGDLHRLLALEDSEGRSAWYKIRKALSQSDGYLDDIRSAWQLAEEEFADLRSSISIGRQCRYALITASLNSLGEDIPLRLPEAARREIGDKWSRVWVLTILGPHLPKPLREKALAGALREAREVGDGETAVPLGGLQRDQRRAV